MGISATKHHGRESPPLTIPRAAGQTATDIGRGKNSQTSPQLTGPTQSKLSPVTTQPTAQSPIQSSQQVSQNAVPQTQLERLVQTDRNLTAGDRERLSNAIFEYAQFLDQGMSLGYKLNGEIGKIGQDRADGSLAKNYDEHIKHLRDISTLGWAYSKNFRQIRDKWNYYSDQTDYIFGVNPDNLGPSALINGAEGLANYLNSWSKIPTKDQVDILNLVAIQQNESMQYCYRVIHWAQDSQQRLNQVKQSIQPNGVVQPIQSQTPAPAVGMFN